MFISKFNGLKELDLGGTNFSRPVPETLAVLKLEKLNISHNNFSGILPNFGESKFGIDVFEGNNPTLCGHPLGPYSGSSDLSPFVITGIVIALMNALVVVASLLIGYFQGKRRKHADEAVNKFEEVEEEEAGCGEGKLILFQELLTDKVEIDGNMLHFITKDRILAHKVLELGIPSSRCLFETVNSSMKFVDLIGQSRMLKAKRCLVVLLSNCSTDWWSPFGFFLVKKDLMIKKFLIEFFIESRVRKPVLNWARRYKIALGYARGLAYLHCLETPVTHGNVMSKNVHVDEFIVSRLTEFGLDKIMIPAVADNIISIVKAEGYKVPELQRMKKCNSRTDVYAFDILLLEILLGKKPGKNGRNRDNVDLPALVKVAVLEETTLEVFDMELLKGIMNPMEEVLV
ncbi:putative kinase-like protein TMKL1 [Capsicum chinense]|nr:putative kinase-like protein TMKL1 [Capsicum chinense]